MRLIVGLGNPGREYAHSRHNVGFWCLNRLARRHGIAFSSRGRLAAVGEGRLAGRPVILAKPRTFVNLSGRAVSHLLQRYRLSPQQLLVVCDDLDLPLGRVRLRASGSHGGHRGMRSIIEAIGSQDFPRIRIGIGRPAGGGRADLGAGARGRLRPGADDGRGAPHPGRGRGHGRRGHPLPPVGGRRGGDEPVQPVAAVAAS